MVFPAAFHGGAVPAGAQAGVVGAVPDQDTPVQQGLEQGGGGVKEQVVGLGGADLQPQALQAPAEVRPLPDDELPGPLQKFPLLQGRQTGGLGGEGHVPGLGEPPHGGEQIPVRRQAAAQPQSRHGVVLGKRLQDEQTGVLSQKGLQAPGLRPAAEVKEALVHEEAGLPLPAQGQDLPQQRRVHEPPGGVVGVAEEENVVPLPAEPVQQVRSGDEALLPPKGQAVHLTAPGRQGGGVLGEGGGQLQGPAGPQGSAVGEDQLRRPIPKQDVLPWHALAPGHGLRQLPAEGVRIPVHPPRGGSRRPADGGRRAQGIGVDGKIQLHGTAIPVAAVGVFSLVEHMGASSQSRRIARALHPAQRTRASADVAYSRRQARGMSRCSISRTGSPI